MVTVKVWQEINAAIGNAKDYTRGRNLGKLRVAFDGLCSQLCHELFGTRPMNRVMARKLLNDSVKAQPSKGHRELIEALRAALRASESTLYRKDYTDHRGSIEVFISKELKNLIQTLP